MPQATITTTIVPHVSLLRRLFGPIEVGTGYLASCLNCRRVIPVDPDLPHDSRCEFPPYQEDPLA